MRLPLRLRQRSHEPGHGVLLRLAARNGRSRVASFARSLGLDLRTVLAGAEVTRIAEVAGVSPSATLWCSPVVSARDRIVTLAGEELALGDWSIGQRRHCVECLRKDAAEASALGMQADWFASHRAWWDVRSVTCCPEHGVSLVNTCSTCGGVLGWRDSGRFACPRCRAALGPAGEILDDPLGRYVAARLGFGASERPPILEELPLRQAIRLCGKLGRAGLGEQSKRTVAGVPERIAGAEGFRRALMGRAGLDDVFEQLLARRASDAPDGLGGAYGWLHAEWLGTDDPTAAPYRDALRWHAVANGVIAADEERLGRSPPPTITLTGAAAEAGVAIERMRRMLDVAGEIPSGSRRGVAFALDPEVVRLAGRRHGAVRSAAREVLGIGRTSLQGLAEAGWIELDDEEALRASAARLLGEIWRQLCAGSPPEGTLTLGEATIANSVPMSRLVQSIVAGAIPAWQADGVGLEGIVVRGADLHPLRVRPDGVTAVETAQALNVHPDCVRALVRDGSLERDANGRISSGSLSDFRATYVAGGEIARRQGRSPKRLVADLAARGIHPAWPLATHRQAIFRRSDLELDGTVH